MLGEKLPSSGFDFNYCKNDADTMIVQMSLDLLYEKNVCVMADDTDIFVLLITQLKDSPGYRGLY